MIVQIKPGAWKDIQGPLLKVEKEIFGKKAFPEDEDCFETFRNPRAYNLAVYDESELVGYLMSERLSESECHKGMKDRDKILYLESVGILAKYQGRGIGKALIELYLEHAKRKNYKKCLLDTAEESMIGLAEHLGFEKIRYSKSFKEYGGSWIMEKNIE